MRPRATIPNEVTHAHCTRPPTGATAQSRQLNQPEAVRDDCLKGFTAPARSPQAVPVLETLIHIVDLKDDLHRELRPLGDTFV